MPAPVRRALVTVIALSTLSLVLPPASADVPTGSSRDFRIIEFNFCGSDCARPAPNSTAPDRAGGATAVKLPELEAKIVAWQPNVVMLDEVCLSQLEQLVTDLGASSWPMDAGPAIATSTTYDGAHPPHVVNNVPVGFVAVDHRRTADSLMPRAACDIAAATGARTFGNAVLVMTGTTLADRQDVPIHVDSSGNVTGLQKGLCVTLSDAPYDTHVCMAHTSPDPRVLAPQQIAYFNDTVVKGYGEGYPEILGGDLNVPPASLGLDSVYDGAQGGTGVYEEADQCPDGREAHLSTCNEYTKDSMGDGNTKLNNKIDYVFLERAYFGLDTATTTVNHSAYSDHGFYRAAVVECSTSDMDVCNPPG